MKWDGEDNVVPNASLIKAVKSMSAADDFVKGEFQEKFQEFRSTDRGPLITIAEDGEKWPEKEMKAHSLRPIYSMRVKHLMAALWRCYPVKWKETWKIRFEYRGNGKIQLWWAPRKKKKAKHDNARQTETTA